MCTPHGSGRPSRICHHTNVLAVVVRVFYALNAVIHLRCSTIYHLFGPVTVVVMYWSRLKSTSSPSAVVNGRLWILIDDDQLLRTCMPDSCQSKSRLLNISTQIGSQDMLLTHTPHSKARTFNFKWHSKQIRSSQFFWTTDICPSCTRAIETDCVPLCTRVGTCARRLHILGHAHLPPVTRTRIRTVRW